MTALFIADLHLSPERPAVTRAFLDFLQEKARNAQRLYILGDLFEAWVGDDDPSALPRQIVTALSDLTATGTALYFQQGNRDFLVGKRFSRETGAVLLADEEVIQLGGEPVLLMHGDTLCTEDHAYQKFRRRVRNPLVKWLLTHLPLKKRLQIAAQWRARSREQNSNKPDHIMDVTPAEVLQRMRHYGVTQLIHGHTHRPARHAIDDDGTERIRWVLGDWGERAWCIEAGDDGALALVNWEVGTVQ